MLTDNDQTRVLEMNMTRAEFKAARHALGLSAQGMARALRVSDGRTIRRWQSGERDIPGPAIIAVRYMLATGTASPDQLSKGLRRGPAPRGRNRKGGQE